MVLKIFAHLDCKRQNNMSDIKMIEVQYDALRNNNKSPEESEENWHLINHLIILMAEGYQLSFATDLTGEELEEALLWCLNRRLRFKYINGKLHSQ